MVQEPGGYVFTDFTIFGVPKTVWNLVFQTVSLALYPIFYVNLIVSIGAFFLIAFLLDRYREWKRKRALSLAQSSGVGFGQDVSVDGSGSDVRVDPVTGVGVGKVVDVKA